MNLSVGALSRLRQRLIDVGYATFEGAANKSSATLGAFPVDRLQILGLFGALLAITAAAIYAANIDIGFSADGAHIFARILDSHTFFHTDAWSRYFSQYAMQWPLVLALKAGVKDLALLSSIYHFSLYLPFLISLGVCWYAIRGSGNYQLLFFPLASYVLVSMPAIAIWAGEVQFLAVIVWPILLLLLRSRLALVDWLVLVSLLFLMSRTYETSAASAAVFIAILGIRILADGDNALKLLLLAVGPATASIVIGGYWTVFPASVANRSDFVSGVTAPIHDPMFLCALAAFGLLTMAAFFKPVRRIAWLAMVIGAISVSLPQFGQDLEYGRSINARNLTVTLLPGLLICGFLFYWKRPVIPTCGWLLGYGTICLLVLGHVHSWVSWSEFRAAFKDELSRNSGYVALENTAIEQDRQLCSWTKPTLSVLWSNECVHTIILNRSVRLRWEPFDPYTYLPLQDYLMFDVAFRHAVQKAQPCK